MRLVTTPSTVSGSAEAAAVLASLNIDPLTLGSFDSHTLRAPISNVNDAGALLEVDSLVRQCVG